MPGQALEQSMGRAEAPFIRSERGLLERTLVRAFGWALLLLGLAGLLLPVLPGWILIAAGLIVLSTEHEWAHRTVQWLRRKHPRIGRMLDKSSEKAHALTARLGRLFARRTE